MAMDAVKIVDGDLDPSLTRDRRQMDQRIRRPANGSVQGDGVLKGLTCQDALGSDILLDQSEDLLAGSAGIAQEFCQRRWS